MDQKAKAFDRKQLNPLEQSVNRIVKTAYTHCIYVCNEKNINLWDCKQQCFSDIMVPYHMMKHQARDAEENLYKQCLAEKIPNLKQEHYVECTKDVYD
jgi:hypothetical protein